MSPAPRRELRRHSLEGFLNSRRNVFAGGCDCVLGEAASEICRIDMPGTRNRSRCHAERSIWQTLPRSRMARSLR